MANPNSTTLVVVGDDAEAAIRALGHLANVRAASFDGEPDEEIDRWIAQAHSPYVVHDHDPLGHVASAWVEFFDDLATIGSLDLEVDRAVAALSHGSATMPDYYVVLNPETLATTWKHWWLGVVSTIAPTRVIPVDDRSPSLTRMLRRLPTGRPWPQPHSWLPGVVRSVPDRVGFGDGAIHL